MSGRTPTKPREHLVAPGNFGFAGPAEWRQPENVEWLVSLRHAEVQHEFVVRLRQVIREDPQLTQAAIARGGSRASDASVVPLMPYKRLNDCINGHKRLSLMDMQRIELVTGSILLGLRFKRTVVADPLLRERFPKVVGRLPESTERERRAQ